MLRGDLAAARGDIAAALADNSDIRGRATGLALMGELASLAGSYTDSREALEQALPLVRDLGDPIILARTLYALGDVHWRLGLIDLAQGYLDESIALAQGTGETTRELFALNRLGIVKLHQGDLPEAERLFRDVLTRAKATGNRERAMHALNNLGVMLEMRGDLPASLESICQALDLARELAQQTSVALFLTNVAELELRLGRPEVTRPLLREGLDLARHLRAAIQLVAGVYRFGMIYAAEGNTARALELFGVAQHHPAFSLDDQRQLDWALAEYKIDPTMAAEGIARGAVRDFDATVEDLLSQAE
jgi:tetratricopeptide (TPR) repeat protein